MYLLIRLFSRIHVSSYVYNDHRTQNNHAEKPREGKVTLESKEKQGKIVPKDEGEYVDYEEIK